MAAELSPHTLHEYRDRIASLMLLCFNIDTRDFNYFIEGNDTAVNDIMDKACNEMYRLIGSIEGETNDIKKTSHELSE